MKKAGRFYSRQEKMKDYPLCHKKLVVSHLFIFFSLFESACTSHILVIFLSISQFWWTSRREWRKHQCQQAEAIATITVEIEASWRKEGPSLDFLPPRYFLSFLLPYSDDDPRKDEDIMKCSTLFCNFIHFLFSTDPIFITQPNGESQWKSWR